MGVSKFSRYIVEWSDRPFYMDVLTGLAVKIIEKQTEPGAVAPELPLRAL